MNQVSRNKSLKLPKQLNIESSDLQSINDEIIVKKEVAIASNNKFDLEKVKHKIEKRMLI